MKQRFFSCVVTTLVVGVGGCGQQTSVPPDGQATRDGPPTGHPKFCPGIYEFNSGGPNNPPDLAAPNNPNITGAIRVYRWRDLEPTPGQYDLSFVRADYSLAAANNRCFGAIITGSDYGGWPAVPDYILADPAYGGTVDGRHGVCVSFSDPNYTFPLTWNAAIQERLNLLYDAFGAQLDPLPRFSFVLGIGETSTGAGNHCAGWTCPRELQAYEDMLVGLQRRFPATPVFASPNFACYDIPTELVPFLVNRCAGMWPPNVKGDNALLDEQAYAPMRTYHDTIATGVLLDPWNDLNNATPRQRLAEVEASIWPHYFVVDLNKNTNAQQVEAAIDQWMQQHGGTYPWSDPPACMR